MSARSGLPLYLTALLVTSAASQTPRPVPYPVVPDKAYRAAVDSGTRTTTGKPGPRYWQNRADYVIHARLLPEQKRLEGRVTITYRNNAPDTLRSLRLALLQNIHKDDALRTIPQNITGGYTLNSVAVNGERLSTGLQRGPRYMVNGTVMTIIPARPTAPTGNAVIDIDFAYTVPQAGITARMGYDTDSLYFLAYWYPHMLVYDDVAQWQDDQFLGVAEFYAPFGDFEYHVTAPDDWLLWGTGVLQNPAQTLSDEVRKRLAAAERSDTTYRIVGPSEFGKTTKKGTNGWLTWTFKAPNVRDVAWLATRHSIWEAARTPVAKGTYTTVHAFWRPSAFRWARSVEYSQKSIRFLSDFTALPYPWPHMTAVEAGGIIGGGMEYPMMTLIGSYTKQSDQGLLGVTAHEEAHMWVPMIVNVDERRYSWFDEGTTSFHTEEALWNIIPDSMNAASRFDGYLTLARMEGEGELMRWSNYHYSGFAFGVASYPKPASILHMLRGVLGEEMFLKAFRTFIAAWAWKHPYPWDMFNTFKAVSGKDLDWFVRTWYYETWTLDQAVAGVKETAEGTEIEVEDKGTAPMPVLIRVTREDSTTQDLRIPETEWLSGKRRSSVTVAKGSPVAKVEIDPKYYFADIDRKNNVWEKK